MTVSINLVSIFHILSSVLWQFPLTGDSVCSVDVTFILPFLVSTTAPSSAEGPWCTTLTGLVIVFNEVEV